MAGSELERQWLQALDAQAYRLPSDGQYLLADCNTRPDFYYAEAHATIYVDGPPHDFPDRQTRDRAQEDALADRGYLVIRFGHHENWDAKFKQYASVFGTAEKTS